MLSITMIMFLQWLLNSITRTFMKTLLRIIYPILDLILHFTLYIIISTWSVTPYPVKNASMVGVWNMNFLITPIDSEPLSKHSHKRERDSPTYLLAFPKENLILTHYMLTAW